MQNTRLLITALGVAAALLMAACSTATAQAPETTSTTTATTDMASMDHASESGHDMDSMDHDMDSMNMGDADATPAYEVTGAAVVSGPFSVLDSKAGLDVGGKAWLARSAAGTTVTIELTGLEPDTDHIAHVHADSCALDGGPHYQHDAEGMDHPPNEIHLAFRSDANGSGIMTAENPTTASDQAVSVVVHTAGDGAPKLACADFSPNG